MRYKYFLGLWVEMSIRHGYCPMHYHSLRPLSAPADPWPSIDSSQVGPPSLAAPCPWCSPCTPAPLSGTPWSSPGRSSFPSPKWLKPSPKWLLIPPKRRRNLIPRAGKEGDSISSSCRSTLLRSKTTSAGFGSPSTPDLSLAASQKASR